MATCGATFRGDPPTQKPVFADVLRLDPDHGFKGFLDQEASSQSHRQAPRLGPRAPPLGATPAQSERAAQRAALSRPNTALAYSAAFSASTRSSFSQLNPPVRFRARGKVAIGSCAFIRSACSAPRWLADAPGVRSHIWRIAFQCGHPTLRLAAMVSPIDRTRALIRRSHSSAWIVPSWPEPRGRRLLGQIAPRHRQQKRFNLCRIFAENAPPAVRAAPHSIHDDLATGRPASPSGPPITNAPSVHPPSVPVIPAFGAGTLVILGVRTIICELSALSGAASACCVDKHDRDTPNRFCRFISARKAGFFAPFRAAASARAVFCAPRGQTAQDRMA